MRAKAMGSGADHRRSGALADNLMAFETAHEHLVTRVPIARGEESVGSVLAGLSSQAFDAVDAVYVVDDLEVLHGLRPFTKLIGDAARAAPSASPIDIPRWAKSNPWSARPDPRRRRWNDSLS
jgi:hypothetical protein